MAMKKDKEELILLYAKMIYYGTITIVDALLQINDYDEENEDRH